MSPENGNYVTRAELKATVEPIHESISGIEDDVRFVRDYIVGQKAVKATTTDKGARRLGLAGLGAGIIAALYWVPDAIAKVIH